MSKGEVRVNKKHQIERWNTGSIDITMSDISENLVRQKGPVFPSLAVRHMYENFISAARFLYLSHVRLHIVCICHSCLTYIIRSMVNRKNLFYQCGSENSYCTFVRFALVLYFSVMNVTISNLWYVISIWLERLIEPMVSMINLVLSYSPDVEATFIHIILFASDHRVGLYLLKEGFIYLFRDNRVYLNL